MVLHLQETKRCRFASWERLSRALPRKSVVFHEGFEGRESTYGGLTIKDRIRVMKKIEKTELIILQLCDIFLQYGIIVSCNDLYYSHDNPEIYCI